MIFMNILWILLYNSSSSHFLSLRLAWQPREPGGTSSTRSWSWRTVTPPPSLCRWAPTKWPPSRAWPPTAYPARSSTTSTAPTLPRPTITTGVRWSLMATTSTLTRKKTQTASPPHPPPSLLPLCLTTDNQPQLSLWRANLPDCYLTLTDVNAVFIPELVCLSTSQRKILKCLPDLVSKISGSGQLLSLFVRMNFIIAKNTHDTHLMTSAIYRLFANSLFG